MIYNMLHNSNLSRFHKIKEIAKYLIFSRNVSHKSTNVTDFRNIRNIGIIAHIDAGKTTTTERMLYYSGANEILGEVHHGDTVTDYMDQERERGITITSAAVTFKWFNHKINLIDTPGHVDFTFEVERALRVLDGAVTILDASAGVEAQTLTVWNQAHNYKIPSLIYLNKMDKPMANFEYCLDSIKKKLKINPIPIHLPVRSGRDFKEIIDLVSMELISWDDTCRDGRIFHRHKLDSTSSKDIWMKANEEREKLINLLTDFDDVIIEKIIQNKTMDCLTHQDIHNSLRRITLSQKASPVLIGSSYHNKGVQLLLDAILRYLPHPKQVKHDFLKYYEPNLCSLVFKIIHDKTHGPLAFVRVYSGKIEQGVPLYNVNKDFREKNPILMVPFANQFTKVQEVTEGNIAVIAGLSECQTGDTLTTTSAIAKQAESSFAKDQNSQEKVAILANIQVPKPVFFCTIEAASPSFEKPLDNALKILQKEDPTFKVQYDESLGQTVIFGMGELHIDVIRKRIQDDFKIEAYLGPLQVSYKEKVNNEVIHEYTLNKAVSGIKNYVKIRLGIKPIEETDKKFRVKVIVTKDNNLGKLYPDHLKAIEEGAKASLNSGPILGFPIVGVDVSLHWLEVSRSTSFAMLRSAAASCLKEAIMLGGSQLLEPLMRLEITTNSHYSHKIITDLSHRRSEILGVVSREELRVIHALTPLSELINYSSHVRSLTSGNVSFSMDHDSYVSLNSLEMKKAIERVTGFAT